MSDTPTAGTPPRLRSWFLVRNFPVLTVFAASGIPLVAAVACAPVPYDFGGDGDDTGTDPIDGISCDDLDPVTSVCGSSDDHLSGCSGSADVMTAKLGESIGCSPVGLSLGVVQAPPPEISGPVELYAWTGTPGTSGDSGRGYLSLFEDVCGDDPFGPDMQCGYRPWLFRSGLSASDGFHLHVQTDEDLLIEMGYQLVQIDDWDRPLPDAEVPLSCEIEEDGHVSDDLLYPNPVEAGEVSLDFFYKSPATATPWICGEAGEGLRQGAYLVRNPLDHPVHVSGVRLMDQDNLQPISFNAAIFDCASGGVVEPGQAALFEGCYAPDGDGLAAADIDLEAWDGTQATEYLLILQVPAFALSPVAMVMDLD